MSEYQLVASGKFTADGNAKDIPLRSDFDYFDVVNYNHWAAVGGEPNDGFRWEWFRGLADGESLKLHKNSSAAVLANVETASMYRIDQGNESVGAAVAISGIARATDVVTTSAAHGLSVDDRVRIYGTTSMLQVAGLEYTVTAVGSPTTATLGYANMSGYAADATAGSLRKLPANPLYSPERLYITNISAASSAVVTFSVTHNLAVGAKLRFNVTSDNGMTEMDGLLGEVTAVSTANNTATVNIDSSAFTAFSFPLSATAAAGYSPAHAVPVGEVQSIVSEATDNQAQILMRLAAGTDKPAGAANDVIYWRAWKAGYVNQE